jgi:hypothetical protein
MYGYLWENNKTPIITLCSIVSQVRREKSMLDTRDIANSNQSEATLWTWSRSNSYIFTSDRSVTVNRSTKSKYISQMNNKKKGLRFFFSIYKKISIRDLVIILIYVPVADVKISSYRFVRTFFLVQWIHTIKNRMTVKAIHTMQPFRCWFHRCIPRCAKISKTSNIWNCPDMWYLKNLESWNRKTTVIFRKMQIHVQDLRTFTWSKHKNFC